VSLVPLCRSIISSIKTEITGGPNKGMKWARATGRRYRRGAFEPPRVAAIERFILPGDCFWDIGAHRGYITLLAARCVGSVGRVLSFEPHPLNIPYLDKHIRWNRLTNVQVFPIALSRHNSKQMFGGGIANVPSRRRQVRG